MDSFQIRGKRYIEKKDIVKTVERVRYQWTCPVCGRVVRANNPKLLAHRARIHHLTHEAVSVDIEEEEV